MWRSSAPWWILASRKSFDRAAKQFWEHYGWEIGRGAVLRHTEASARQAERYV